MKKMTRRSSLLVLAACFSAALPAQDIRHETRTINIEVPVRVFKGNTFVDKLSLGDFELYEDGKRQKVEALYLVRKTVIERHEEERDFIQIGYSESRAILAEMTDLARIMASDIRAREVVGEPSVLPAVDPSIAVPVDSAYQGGAFEEKLMHYATLLSRLDSLRVVDQKKFLAFAGHLKDLEGQKGVFLFYQRELVPKIDPRLVDMLASKYNQRPDIAQSLNTIFGLDKREVSLDVDSITKAYADSSASIHFLHIARPAERAEGIRMEEPVGRHLRAFPGDGQGHGRDRRVDGQHRRGHEVGGGSLGELLPPLLHAG